MFDVMDMDQQVNADDCGLHAAATAYELCAGNDPTGIQWQHELLRTHLKECLEQQLMKPFPRADPRPSRVIRASIAVPLYCTCRMPEGRSAKMAQCTKCDEWFHQTCSNIPRVFFLKKRESVPWTCSSCKN